MISRQRLIKVIEDFDNKFNELNEKFENDVEKTWSLDDYQKWQAYEIARRKLEEVVELSLLPLIK